MPPFLNQVEPRNLPQVKTLIRTKTGRSVLQSLSNWGAWPSSSASFSVYPSSQGIS